MRQTFRTILALLLVTGLILPVRACCCGVSLLVHSRPEPAGCCHRENSLAGSAETPTTAEAHPGCCRRASTTTEPAGDPAASPVPPLSTGCQCAPDEPREPLPPVNKQSLPQEACLTHSALTSGLPVTPASHVLRMPVIRPDGQRLHVLHCVWRY